jgi:hypothetical protein
MARVTACSSVLGANGARDGVPFRSGRFCVLDNSAKGRRQQQEGKGNGERRGTQRECERRGNCEGQGTFEDVGSGCGWLEFVEGFGVGVEDHVG